MGGNSVICGFGLIHYYYNMGNSYPLLNNSLVIVM